MAKRSYEPYDPEMRTSDNCSPLYNAWRSMKKHPHCESWESYAMFYNWAVYNGYTPGARLQPIDVSQQYGPDNCVWCGTDDADRVLTPEEQKRADEWNTVVNRIRKRLGMPPLEGTSYADD